jgi:hypothetical protein
MYCACVAARLACSCANFIGLCNKNAPNSYLNSIFHRVVPGAWIQVNAVRRAKPKPDAYSDFALDAARAVISLQPMATEALVSMVRLRLRLQVMHALLVGSAYAETLFGAVWRLRAIWYYHARRSRTKLCATTVSALAHCRLQAKALRMRALPTRTRADTIW